MGRGKRMIGDGIREREERKGERMERRKTEVHFVA